MQRVSHKKKPAQEIDRKKKSCKLKIPPPAVTKLHSVKPKYFYYFLTK